MSSPIKWGIELHTWQDFALKLIFKIKFKKSHFPFPTLTLREEEEAGSPHMEAIYCRRSWAGRGAF